MTLAEEIELAILRARTQDRAFVDQPARLIAEAIAARAKGMTDVVARAAADLGWNLSQRGVKHGDTIWTANLERLLKGE